MTIIYNQFPYEFDEDPALAAQDRAQPVYVEPGDDFVSVGQWNYDGEALNYILVEYRDVQAFIDALQECL